MNADKDFRISVDPRKSVAIFLLLFCLSVRISSVISVNQWQGFPFCILVLPATLMNRTASFAASVRGVARRHIHSFSALLIFLALGQAQAQSPAHAPQTRPVPGPLAAPKTTPSVPYPKEAGRITFAAAGEVIPHQPVVRAASAHKHPAPAKSEAAPARNTNAPDPADNHT